MPVRKGLPEDLVLGKESGERRNAGRCAKVAARKVQNVIGIFWRRPPILRMSCSPPIAWITEPEPRNRQALKNACVIRWNMPAVYAPTPTRREHVAELAHGRVREHFLDVVLREADGRGEQRGRARRSSAITPIVNGAIENKKFSRATM